MMHDPSSRGGQRGSSLQEWWGVDRVVFEPVRNSARGSRNGHPRRTRGPRSHHLLHPCSPTTSPVVEACDDGKQTLVHEEASWTVGKQVRRRLGEKIVD
jgi:hypothetical protein